MPEQPRPSARRLSGHSSSRRPPRLSAAPAAPSSGSTVCDLRRLESYCQASSQRCAALEHSLARLEHDVDARISQWDDHLASLTSVDERAKQLTAQLTAQLAALRTAAGPQVAQARIAVGESQSRVNESDASLDKSIGNVERARRKLDELQRQFKDKEAALERAESWLSWLTGLAILLLAVLAAVAAYFANLHHSL
ncbi:hypothetical protein JCM3775_007386 [Rhodotorula graminis]|uniref:Uncharacterized protein n=1 Tax=Rhodotorula graminis (strain WP1) TaxID=578459 RepID=A0A194S4M8_RHOGW|nr:uncharacterized protein RHOBADRAFT_53442 [Rhodotorula graminis WP1]KPV75470.1 hypothetical protein RHOBADRAFT_53442 [Rhodotorula graminis WP1]